MLRYSLLSILGVFLILSCNKESEAPKGEKPSVALEIVPTTNSIHHASVKSIATLTGENGYDSIGFCIDTHPRPVRANTNQDSYALSATAGMNWHFLIPNTTYYVRAFIYGVKGTIYSNEISFTTAPYFTAELHSLNKEVMVFDSVFNLKQTWSSQNTITGANSATDGKANTQKIVDKNTGGAANYCDE